MGLFQSDNSRHIKKLKRIADKIEALEGVYHAKTDEELRACTAIFRERYKNGEKLDDMLPEAYACAREAAFRVLEQRAFYVQLLGAIALHQGRIAEMKTGEGKTLTCVFPAYLNAISGEPVHIVEVNEYLAKRNAEWMGKVHRFLGLTVGFSRSRAQGDEKRDAYNCDITYVTSSELGFDYLRDNVAHRKENRVLRGSVFAIVDEADSIMIDESRTPLIMSAPTEDCSEQYKVCDRFVRTLREGDYEVDLKERAVRLTEEGISRAERNFGIENISDAEHMPLNHYINNALKANFLFAENDHYIINKDKQIQIVDENTGRVLVGRRYGDGLHQAIEAKEGVPIRNEEKTIATITIQNLFRLYKKLSGMTGTAKTEEQEFQKIYGVDVVSIPTNKPMQRVDAPDVIFTTIERKYQAVVEDVVYRHDRGQPVLIGTTTIEKSEEISALLRAKKIPHNVLNAKNHEQESDIVAQAGKFGAVTIATNMAGRGTDILLGGNAEYLARQELQREGLDAEQIYSATSFEDASDKEVIELRSKYKKYYEKFKEETAKEKAQVIELGGLHIIGTERHDSRRIDNQLRGRAGRQGDPGSSIFYISTEDELVRRFGKDIIGGMLRLFKMDDVQSKMLTRFFERVQKRVEGFYFDARRRTFELDNVMNDQRELIYRERNQILDGEDVHKQVLNMFPEIVSRIVSEAIDTDKNYIEWNLERANEVLGDRLFGKKIEYLDAENTFEADYTEVEQMVLDAVIEQYEEKTAKLKELGLNFAALERDVLLSVVDNKWIDHIDAMVDLRNGIALRDYGQKNHVAEYRREAGIMFEEMVEKISEQTALYLFKIQIEKREKPMPIRNNLGPVRAVANDGELNNNSRAVGTGTKGGDLQNREVGRNDQCPCGSGKKYKNCCGAN